MKEVVRMIIIIGSKTKDVNFERLFYVSNVQSGSQVLSYHIISATVYVYIFFILQVSTDND